ncbi:hypothetical protein GA0115259_104461, partial [Streptomyces sp. MnatMP-M17]
SRSAHAGGTASTAQSRSEGRVYGGTSRSRSPVTGRGTWPNRRSR